MDDHSEAHRQRASDLSKDYEAVRSQYRLDPAPLIFCAERAKLLLGSYRRNDANDPDVYVQAITLVLSEFPKAVVEYATDPRSGIQATEQFRSFPPNSGELRAFCQQEVNRAHRMAQPAPKLANRFYTPPPSFAGCRANVFVHADAPQYPALKAWQESGDADSRDWKWDDEGRSGIWVALSIVENMGGLAKGRIQAASDAMVRAELGRREAEASHGAIPR